MADEVVHPKDVSRDFLYSLFNSAYMDVSVDSDGDIHVQDKYGCWLFPLSEGRYIRLMSQFRANPSSSLPDRILFVNKVNDELKLIRAYLKGNGGIGFDYFIVVEGGITKRNIVAATRIFLGVLDAVAEIDTDNVMA